MESMHEFENWAAKWTDRDTSLLISGGSNEQFRNDSGFSVSLVTEGRDRGVCCMGNIETNSNLITDCGNGMLMPMLRRTGGIASTVSDFGEGINTDLYLQTGSSVGLSMPQVIKDAEPGVHRSNNVNECGTSDTIPRQPTCGTTQTDLFVDRVNGSPTGCSTLTDHSFDRVKGNTKSPGSGCRKGINTGVSKARSNKNGVSKRRSGVYAAVMEALESPVSSYSLLYEQPSILTSEILSPKKKDRPSSVKSKTEARRESKLEEKTLVKKGKPKGQITNVKGLTGTGMLDGVMVHYVSSSGKLPGVIKGSSYLCGCTSCKYSEELSADEFERHAGRKTSHPNNHIQFDTGKTIFQMVQELRRTPERMVFDVIQTNIGSPLSPEAFRAWKEKFRKKS